MHDELTHWCEESSDAISAESTGKAIYFASLFGANVVWKNEICKINIA